MYISKLNHGNAAGLTLMASSKPHFLPKTPSPNVATVGIGVSTDEFGSDAVESVQHLIITCIALHTHT